MVITWLVFYSLCGRKKEVKKKKQSDKKRMGDRGVKEKVVGRSKGGR